jgi:hypothetical protein
VINEVIGLKEEFFALDTVVDFRSRRIEFSLYILKENRGTRLVGEWA